jgi:uncharacterized RDD family membrane protein YckC
MSAPVAVQYVGFWKRVFAALIDSIVVAVALAPLLAVLGLNADMELGADGLPVLNSFNLHGFAGNTIITAAIVLGFWIWKMATPGKMIIGAVIVDAQTFAKPTTGQFMVRYIGYYLSTIPFLLGLIWVGLDRRKQGWHDKLANTVVVKKTAPAVVAAEDPIP